MQRCFFSPTLFLTSSSGTARLTWNFMETGSSREMEQSFRITAFLNVSSYPCCSGFLVQTDSFLRVYLVGIGLETAISFSTSSHFFTAMERNAAEHDSEKCLRARLHQCFCLIPNSRSQALFPSVIYHIQKFETIQDLFFKGRCIAPDPHHNQLINAASEL